MMKIIKGIKNKNQKQYLDTLVGWIKKINSERKKKGAEWENSIVNVREKEKKVGWGDKGGGGREGEREKMEF